MFVVTKRNDWGDEGCVRRWVVDAERIAAALNGVTDV